MEREQITISRRQIGQWAGFIGGVGLLIGVFTLLLQRGLNNFSIITLVVGVIGVGLWALMSPREFVNFVTGRQARYGTTAVFSTLLLIGIVGMAYVYLQRQVITLDMTEGGRFSLSEETLDVLEAASRSAREIQITGFYTREDLQLRDVDDQFFRLYEVATEGRISRNYVDPDEQPGIAERFAQRYGIINEGYNVFLSYLNEDGTIDFASTIRVPRSSRQERDMTESVSRLLIAGEFTVYFETGHGELDPLDNTQQGLSGVNNGIRESGLITNPLNLREIVEAGESIPEDASALIMARPISQLSVDEIAVVDAYLQDGGALFIMSDPLFGDDNFLAEDSAFNQYLWENYGLRALDAVVVDPAAGSQTALDIFSYAVFGGTDIGMRLNVENDPDTLTLFRMARAVEVDDTPPVNNGNVIMSSEVSYGETNLRALSETNTYEFDEQEDLPGPLTTVAWAWDLDTDARVLLVGDGEFVTNGQVTISLGNAILFTDGLAWMTGFGERVSFSPEAFSTGLPLLSVSGSMLDIIALITVIIMPGSVLALGLAIWARRMRR